MKEELTAAEIVPSKITGGKKEIKILFLKNYDGVKKKKKMQVVLLKNNW